jgi:uncharacterized protein YeaO (DUF488 family)
MPEARGRRSTQARGRRPLAVKRVYAPAATEDGLRVLVDRLWPRGLNRRQACAHQGLKEAAPSAPLRRWFGHDPRRWRRFRAQNRAELRDNPELLVLLEDLRRRSPVTLLFGARDEAHNNAVVLRELLEEKRRKGKTQ